MCNISSHIIIKSIGIFVDYNFLCMFLENTTDRKIKGTAEIRKTAWIESGRTELISINYVLYVLIYVLINVIIHCFLEDVLMFLKVAAIILSDWKIENWRFITARVSCPWS